MTQPCKPLAAPTLFGGVTTSAQLAEKEVQLAKRSARFADQGARLDKQSAQAAEYLYHLDRINAWGWFRLGVFLDRVIRAPVRLVAKQWSIFISSKSRIAFLDPSTAKVAIIIHAYYLDVFKMIIKSSR